MGSDADHFMRVNLPYYCNFFEKNLYKTRVKKYMQKYMRKYTQIRKICMLHVKFYIQIVVICVYSVYLSSYIIACLLAERVQLNLCGWLHQHKSNFKDMFKCQYFMLSGLKVIQVFRQIEYCFKYLDVLRLNLHLQTSQITRRL